MSAPKSSTIIRIARHAGDQILMPNWGNVTAEIKSDGSPVSFVDKQASTYIIGQLNQVTPNIPVVSEEQSETQNRVAQQGVRHWMIDPLDGTQTYLDGCEDAGFGVHIGLIEKHRPVFGVVYLPAQGRMFFTGDDGRAYLQVNDAAPELIQAPQSLEDEEIHAAVPWSRHKRPLNVNGYDYHAVPAVGGEALCQIACGAADLMWHNRPDQPGSLESKGVFSHWDVAAAHAVLIASGGDLYEMTTRRPLKYDRSDFAVIPFVAGHHEVLAQINFDAERAPQIRDPRVDFDPR